MEYFYRETEMEINIFENFGKKNKNFGINNSIIYNGETETELTYYYMLTQADKKTDEICPQCDGSGKFINDLDCVPCHGTGNKHVTAYHHFSDFLISLYPIIKFANLALMKGHEKEESSGLNVDNQPRQKITVEYSLESVRNECSMWGWLDEKIFGQLKDIEKDAVTSSMKEAERILRNREPDKYDYDFRIVDKDIFYLQVPGDACTLGTSRHSVPRFFNFGRQLEPHNIDSRFQQIYFLFGLAQINTILNQEQITPLKLN